MSYINELNSSITDICKKAIDGHLKLYDFYSQWPKEANHIHLFKQIFEDVDDGIQHTPGYWFKRGINYNAWRASTMYLTLYLDLSLLSLDKNYEDLMRCREHVLKESKLSEELIVRGINEYFERQNQREHPNSTLGKQNR